MHLFPTAVLASVLAVVPALARPSFVQPDRDMTNSQRLARGLPVLQPRSLWSPTSMAKRHHPSAAPSTPAEPGYHPGQTFTCAKTATARCCSEHAFVNTVLDYPNRCENKASGLPSYKDECDEGYHPYCCPTPGYNEPPTCLPYEEPSPPAPTVVSFNCPATDYARCCTGTINGVYDVAMCAADSDTSSNACTTPYNPYCCVKQPGYNEPPTCYQVPTAST